jgi:hypothetical protein
MSERERIARCMYGERILYEELGVRWWAMLDELLRGRNPHGGELRRHLLRKGEHNA